MSGVYKYRPQYTQNELGPSLDAPTRDSGEAGTPKARIERMSDWILCSKALPPEGVEVESKIDNEDGCRNETTLKFSRNLWWFPDMSMYVYYSPTHWRYIEPHSKSGERSRE